jgi:beta-galactosidase
VSAGADIGADGLIGRKVIGKGVAVFCQVDPDRFQADKKTYFRYTRWRSTRAVAQLLANLGASFLVDRQVFHPGGSLGYYHPDYRTDFPMGDNPYRYYRW